MNSNLIMLAAIAAILVAANFAAAIENSAPKSPVEEVAELPSVGAEKLEQPAATKKVEPINGSLHSKLVGFASDRMSEFSNKYGLGYLANRMSQGQSRENWAY